VKRGRTGEYEISIVGGERIYAFVPFPLPPDPPLEMTSERQRLLERATLALGRLDSISLLLPDPNLFLYSYVRREAVLSSQIEGTQSTLTDLLRYEVAGAGGMPIEDVTEVSSYVSALEYGLKRLQEGFPLSGRLIREMHAVLLAQGRGSEKEPGEFRRSQNWIGGTRPGNAQFVPPPHHRVGECMANLERFLHDPNSAYPSLVKAGLAHVQFETIHPFLDGNGRIGRLLITFILHREQVLTRPLLYLSLYLKKHREEYYRLLNAVRFEGDWEAWIDFFLEGVDQTATNAVETARHLVELFQNGAQAIQQVGRRASTALNVFRLFCQKPLLSIPQISEQAALSYPAVSNAIQVLEALGIVEEITEQRRNRLFAYKEYLRILSEGTEPL